MTQHQTATQTKTKQWFNRTRTFDKGDKVLVFTPAITYTIPGRLSPVTYMVDMPERHKHTRSVHVTALKGWQSPISNIAYISVEHTDTADVPDYHPRQEEDQPQLGLELTRRHADSIEDVPRHHHPIPGKSQIYHTPN